ncbi:hypothetical protein [Polynucleobacter sp. UB-Tiil-W10]|uniref:hypothetical protein n=1 Tax=Polynucleobacter sp. UB-Tiil-W10 TaxID=1855648 RepID=UPI001C0AC508|nr:hypothetical protein [Polynucleobacter sp. UB-Tiil-W10]MBU3541643.1 hypothetical protein [Polynucleobacter sp. UB-Tiil-W10]
MSQPTSSGLTLIKNWAPLLLLEAALVFAWSAMNGSYEGLHIGSWQIIEWLINYQSGFVRRGLGGELIFSLSNGASLLKTLYHSTLFFYCSYCVIFVAIYCFAKIRQPKVLLIALLVPGGLFQMGITIQFFTRKEILFLILFGCLCLEYLWIRRATLRSRQFGLSLFYVTAIVGGVLMTLVHEGYLFMAYPLTLLFLWINFKENTASWIARIGLVSYTLIIPIVFLICAKYHGNADAVQLIWDSLPLADRLELSPAAPYTAFGPIASLGWGFQQNLLTIYGVFATGGWKYWLIFIVGNFFTLAYLFTQLSTHLQQVANSVQINKKYLSLLFFGVFISSGMFIIAADWGRWIAYITNSLILFAFVMTQSDYIIGNVSVHHSQNRILQQFTNLSFKSWFFILILLYCLLFKLPECCIHPSFVFMPYQHYFRLLM